MNPLDRSAGEQLQSRATQRGAVRSAPDYAAVFAALPAASAVFAADAPTFTVLAVSASFAAAAADTRGSLVGLSLADAFPEPTNGDGSTGAFESLRASLELAVQTGMPQRMPQVRQDVWRPDGSWDIRYWDAVNTPVHGPDGSVRWVLHQTEDVSARVLGQQSAARTEAALRTSEALAAEQLAQLEAIYRDAPVGLAVLDLELRYLHINDRLAAMNGIPVEAHIGRTVRDLLPGVADVVEPVAQHVLDTGQPLKDMEFTAETPEHPGIVRVFVEQWYPLRNPAAAVVGFNVVVEEVTERRQAEAERERLLREAEAARAEAEVARARADEANRAKSEFLAVMSHELRTPLNAIGGYAELLEQGIRGPVTEQQREDLRRISASQRHLLGLINDVLNYAKLETATVRYDPTDVRLREALASAEAHVAPQAQSKGLSLEIASCPADLVVRADAEKLQQVLLNLISNAIKFTDRGGRVSVTCQPDRELVRIVVCDTGIGISADQMERIFEPFVQVRSERTRIAEGTGLGLAISRDLARGMDGDLTVTSELGAGSAFTLTLPAPPERAV